VLKKQINVSVIVNRLSKVYGSQKAVDEVSFTAEPGKILGFLGPNGAGKSTTMKIITCFIPASSGSVSVCGFDTQQNSMEVRKRIGYLPEHNPLYLEMYVKEYLAFVAGLHGMKNPKARIQEMIQLTGLEREQHKKIAELSKGYRQRVGLAQAMIHNPDVLILDEPTSGLDPNQLSEIRNLIKKIGKEKTVILSTHIMQEVEAICDQVVIINKGKIVANDDTKNLQQHALGEYVFKVEFDKVVDQQKLESIAGVKKAQKVNDKLWLLTSTNDEQVRSAIFDFAVKNNLVLLSIQKEEEKLEDVFRRLTKKNN
jgi:ABC-2 type transport system ATP-binding protein